jgi:hypothetical protein
MGVVQKIGNFLGVKKFSDALASTSRVLSGEVKQDREVQAAADDTLTKLTYAMRQEKDPEKKLRLQQLAQQQLNSGRTTESDIDPGLNLNAKEIYGSGANVVLNALTPGAFKGGKLAQVAKNAGLGVGFGAASGLEKNRSASGVVGSATGGALVGAGIGATGLLAKAAKDFVGNKVPEYLMNKAVRPSLDDLKKSVKFGGPTLGKELLDEGVKGGPKKLLEIADNKLNQLEDDLQSLLDVNSETLGKTISRDQLGPYLNDLIKQKAGTPGLEGQARKVVEIFNSIPESMTLSEANVMKRRIYTELRDVGYKLDPKLGLRGSALKGIAKGLKKEIEGAVGGDTVPDLNKKLSIYGRLEDSIVDQLAREMRNNGLGLTDAILLSGGQTGVLALLRNLGTRAQTYSAQGLKKTGEVLSSSGAKAVKDTIRKSALNVP